MPEKTEIQCLEDFILNNADLELLEEITEKFNIFTSLNIIGNEIRHSTFLSWLMDPMESHGLGDYFLHSFLKRATFHASSIDVPTPRIFEIDSWSFDGAEIRREWNNIDILIISENNQFVCAIENKVYSGEHSQQLQRYKKIVKDEYPDFKHLFVFLTVKEDKPSDEEYVPMSYDDVKLLIENLVERKKEKVGTEIINFIQHYQEMLRRYIMEDSEIQEICQRIYKNHKRALELIYDNKPDLQLEIFEMLKGEISNNTDLILDETNKSSIRFTSKNLDFIPKKGVGWTINIDRILLFEIQNRTDEVRMYLVIGPGDSDLRQNIYDISRSNTSLFTAAKRKLGDKWSTIYVKRLFKYKKDEDVDWETTKGKIESNFEKFLETDLIEIEKTFDDHKAQLIAR